MPSIVRCEANTKIVPVTLTLAPAAGMKTTCELDVLGDWPFNVCPG